MAEKSVETQIVDQCVAWLKSYGLAYKRENDFLANDIDSALKEYHSKSGGSGGNRVDCKLLLTDDFGETYPVLIECKGYKDKLVKLDANGQVHNADTKNISAYAVNGAVHYANALLHFTTYENIIAIGVTGSINDFGVLEPQIGVYWVSKKNFGTGQKAGDFSDLSFLKKENFQAFLRQIEELDLTAEEKERRKNLKDAEIDAVLMKLNNDIYGNEKGLGENDRAYLIAASIIATLGVKGQVPPLNKDDLKSQSFVGGRDGDIMISRIEAFLTARNTPASKRDLIVRTLKNTLLSEHVNKVTNGESQLKRVFCNIVDELGLYYKIGLTTDFTGKLFNEMYRWLGFSQDKLNDVVLTPFYVATFLAKLARVNKDSYVWDFATGSAGLLVAAMNEMIDDAALKIKSPEELEIKKAQIKGEQLLGLEILQNVYMLAVLNMFLMGDGSTNLLNQNSLDYQGKTASEKTFPADAFLLNPPYSALGCGMIFVERALSMMQKGYAAIIIQSSAGSGKAQEYNRRILKHSTLLASIKMPVDLFAGKSSVQTYVYVFRVGEPHNPKNMVRFLDIGGKGADGYTRTTRRKASVNLKNTDHAPERYQELVNVVHFGRDYLKRYGEEIFYENVIDPENGADWNQSRPIDTRPKMTDFQNVVQEYLAWRVGDVIKNSEKESAQNF